MRSELHPRLKRDHSWTAIATQTDAQQAGRRSSCVGKRSKASLRGRLSRNTGQHHAWQPKVRVVEDIEKLALKPKLCMLGQRKPLCQVEVAPDEIGTAQRIAAGGSELAMLRVVAARALPCTRINR